MDALVSGPGGAAGRMHDPLIGKTLGRHQILDLLGRGGMGAVYRALHMGLGQERAIKVLVPMFADDPTYVSLFEREARLAASLRHPHIVHIYDVANEDGHRYIAMELLVGRPLDSLLGRDHLPLSRAMNLLRQLAAALDYAHSLGVVHRDIKPANAMVAPNDHLTLVDFGIARAARQSGLTQTMVTGTPYYMAPEVWEGQGGTRAADIYALAVVAFQVLTGQVPFPGPSPASVMRGHLREPPPSARSLRLDLPHAVEDLFRPALAKAAQDRPETAGTFVAQLAAALGLEDGAGQSHAPQAPSEQAGCGLGSARVNDPLRASPAAGFGVPAPSLGAVTGIQVADSLDLATISRPPSNLPSALNEFIGRTAELAEVRRLLRDTRLVTLTGAGGMGKTRLALQAAAHELDQRRADLGDGVWLVDLAGATESGQVAQAMLAALRLREEPGQSLVDLLERLLQPKRLLLILDNCEQVVEACAALADRLLRACPGLRVLATSRTVLGIAGEVTILVPPLGLSSDGSGGHAVDGEDDAVRLFVARATARNPRLTLGPAEGTIVAEICRQLDGIPLAIELAAARCRALSVSQVAARLSDRLKLLTGGSPLIPRHQTLRATIDWSYDLLSEHERTLFRRLSVFAGSWSLESAEAICADDDLDMDDVLDLLTQLVDRSLVLVDHGADVATYTMLETIRQYAAERLVEAGDLAVGRRHADYYLALSREIEPGLRSPERASLLDSLERAHDNFRAAIRWYAANNAAEHALELAGYLWQFWYGRGYLSEGRTTLANLLAQVGPVAAREQRARALNGLGNLDYEVGDHVAASAHLRESLAIRRTIGDEAGVADVLNNLGNLAFRQGDLAASERQYAESLELRRRTGDRWAIAASLNNLGTIARRRRDLRAARTLYQESLDIERSLGNRRGIADTLNGLGNLAYEEGDLGAARAAYEESLAHERALGERMSIAITLNNLGNIAAAQGDAVAGRAFLEESLAIKQSLGGKRSIAITLNSLGDLAAEAGDLHGARARYLAGLEIRRAIEDRQGVATTLSRLGQVSFRLGDAAAGREFLTECLGILDPEHDATTIAETLVGLARLLATTGMTVGAARLVGAAEAALAGAGRAGVLSAATDVRGLLPSDDPQVTAALAAGQLLTPMQAVTETLNAAPMS